MIRRILLPSLALALAACAGGDAGPDLTYVELVGNAGGNPFDVMPSPDGARLAWAQPVDGKAAILVAGVDGSEPVPLSQGTWDFQPIWSPDGRWIAYAGESPDFDLFVVRSDGGESRQLTSGPARDAPAGWLPDGSGIVFYRQGMGGTQTLVVPSEGGEPYPVVAPRPGDQFVAVSPDGSKAAFDLRRGGTNTLWVQDLPDGTPRQLTTEGFETGRPTRNMWSPDSRRLVYASRRTGTLDLWTVDVESGERRQLTSDVRNDQGATWSPDGRWIAFASDRGGQWDLWIVPSDGGAALRVTNDLAREGGPEWSPDGHTLFYERARIEGALGVTAPDGGEPRMLVEWPGYPIENATLSPDGGTALFSGDRSGNTDVWSVPFTGGEPTPFAASPLEDLHPRFSPDGSQVVFASNRAGSWDVWVMPAAGGEARQLTSWPTDEYRPRWSPDGSAVVFVSNRESAQQDLWVVPADGGEPRRVTNLNAAVVDGGARWSPDGRNLHVVVTAADGARVLYRVPASGGRPQELDASTAAGSGEVSPDGSLYAYSAIEAGWGFIDVTPTAGGARRRITRPTEWVYQRQPIWSPDGTRLTVSDWTFDDATSDLLEMALRDTTRRRLTSRPNSFETPWTYTPDGRQVLFTVDAPDVRIMSVRVDELLAGR